MIVFCKEESQNSCYSKNCKFQYFTTKDTSSSCNSPCNVAVDPCKKCKFLSSILKNAFPDCCTFRGKAPPSSPTPQEEQLNSYFNDEQEVSEIISKYTEAKIKRKMGTFTTDFEWNSILPTGDIPMAMQQDQKGTDDEADEVGFLTPHSRLSRCSSASSLEAFATAKSTFSRSSSLSRLDMLDIQNRRSIIHQLSHCEGWPFGLCRKLLMLPPLPKSPSDSWLWNKSAIVVKIHTKV